MVGKCCGVFQMVYFLWWSAILLATKHGQCHAEVRRIVSQAWRRHLIGRSASCLLLETSDWLEACRSNHLAVSTSICSAFSHSIEWAFRVHCTLHSRRSSSDLPLNVELRFSRAWKKGDAHQIRKFHDRSFISVFFFVWESFWYVPEWESWTNCETCSLFSVETVSQAVIILYPYAHFFLFVTLKSNKPGVLFSVYVNP